MKKRILKNIEWGILICVILLITIGIIALYSATKEANGEELKKQIILQAIYFQNCSLPIFLLSKPKDKFLLSTIFYFYTYFLI